MYRNISFHPVIKNQFKNPLSLFSQQTYSICVKYVTLLPKQEILILIVITRSDG